MMAMPSEVESGRALYGHELDRWLLDALRIEAGDRVLELAGGAGDFALRIVAQSRSGGTVLCSDLKPEMVAEAARRARDAGRGEVQTRILDMLTIDLPDASVDAVACRWGFMFPVPVAQAFREARRVLRPGGRLALAVWGNPVRNPWSALVDSVIRDAGLDPPDRSSPGQMFSLSDPRELEREMMEAGFEKVELAEVGVEWTYPSASAHWNVDVRWAGGVLDAFLSRLSTSQVELIRARLETMLVGYRSPEGEIRLPGVALGARACLRI